MVRAAARETARSSTTCSHRSRAGAVRNGGLIVPLLVEQRVIGVVELFDSTRARAFGDDDVASVEAVCRVAAMAIANAGLYRDAQLRTRESELLNRVASRASSSLETADHRGRDRSRSSATLVPLTDACLVMEGAQAEWEVVYSTSPALEDARARTQTRRRTDVLESLRTRARDRPRPHGRAAGVRRGAGAPPAGRRCSSACSSTTRSPACSCSERRSGMPSPAPTARSWSASAPCSRSPSRTRVSTRPSRRCTSPTSRRSSRRSTRATTTPSGTPRAWPPTCCCSAASSAGRQNRLQQITEAAFLHDVGRIGISDDVLYKPGRLTDEEAAELRRHPIASAEIIQPLFTPETSCAPSGTTTSAGTAAATRTASPGERIPRGRPRPVHRRLLRRDVVPAPAPRGAVLRRVPRRAGPLPRDASSIPTW